MRIFPLLIGALGIGLASGESVAPTVLIANGAVAVTSEDFEAFMLRVPENYRPEARSSYEWIGKAADLLYENRVLAEEARRLGHDKDPLIALRMKQVEESFLAQVWTDRFRKAFRPPDVAVRAEEVYRLNPQRFTTPETVSGTQIVISFESRTREMAKAIAEDLYAKARAGADMSELAANFSDDPNLRRERVKGRFVGVRKSGFVEAVSEAVFALKSPGDITPPVESQRGYHIVKLDRKEPARLRPFKEVEAAIVAEEVDRLRNAALEADIARLKSPSTLVVHTKNIEALRVEVDRSVLERANREALQSPGATVPAAR